ncbi:MAG TPA: hypothetical protein VF027_06635 [Sphingomicrobium sp.]
MNDDRREWFAPKRYGYGAGLPIRWQGWAVIVGFLAIAGAARLLFDHQLIPVLAIMIPAVVALLVVTARTTRGGWRWRWGEED